MKVYLLDNELPLLVLLTTLVCPCIRPPNHILAPFTKNIIDTVETSNQQSVFRGADLDVYTVIKEICSSVAPMKTLRDDLVVACQVGSTLSARVNLGSV